LKRILFMSKRSDIDLLDDIFTCLERIQVYISGLSYDDFASDQKTQDAVIRNIEILGEASKKLSEDIKQTYNEIPWKMIAGTRDRLIHDYFGVNIDIIWEIATIDVPELKEKIAKIKNDFYG